LLVETNYANVAAAKMDGLRAECASILSEHVREEIDLAGIGRMLAMTANDEVNALAVREFAHLFGRANVYQLPPWDRSSGRRASVAEHLRGRLLFDRTLNHDELEVAYRSGSALKKTHLTAEFTYADFLARYGDSARILFLLDETKRLHICTADKPPEPKASQSLVFLVREPTSVPVG
ncbi:MAG: sodium:proton exchanger, partial [Planctomycetales bacterium]|nr:sodium:proton exchanger [Planctomycetales bacterium]